MSWFMVMLAAYGAAYYLFLVSYVRRFGGNPFLPTLCVWVCSALPIAFLAIVFEKRSPSELVNFSDFAWSFLIGDTVVLPALAVVSAYAWSPAARGRRRKSAYAGLLADRDEWYCKPWWTMVCLAFGLLGALAFRWIEMGNYAKAGAASALVSPTKLMHDFVAFPVLLGAVLCLCIPVVMFSPPIYRWTVVALAVVMLALMVTDTQRGLDPNKLHPKGEWRGFEFVVERA